MVRTFPDSRKKTEEYMNKIQQRIPRNHRRNTPASTEGFWENPEEKLHKIRRNTKIGRFDG